MNRFDFPCLKVFFADGGYTGKLIDFVKNIQKPRLEARNSQKA
jgi:hypothetical protein